MMFGENRVQEAEQKFPVDRPRGMDLHLIGHLQSNKAKKAVSLFDAIDSVDSLKLAQKLESLLDKPLPILLEYKTAVNDSAKSGFETPDELFSALEQISSFRHLTVKGLMTIGPLGAGEKETRNAFALLCKTAQMARLRFPHLDFSTLSMGMSQDYGWAIEEGSTRIRIGSALFGAREYV
jgi:pyridoxal phosphate enzyme (YggS family)